MNPEHVIVPSQTEVRLVETIDHSATRAEPSAEQQQTADDVFSRDQEQMVAALLAAQVAVGLLHNCAVEAFRPEAEPERPRKKERPEGEEER
jgi:hypothetical protein